MATSRNCSGGNERARRPTASKRSPGSTARRTSRCCCRCSRARTFSCCRRALARVGRSRADDRARRGRASGPSRGCRRRPARAGEPRSGSIARRSVAIDLLLFTAADLRLRHPRRRRARSPCYVLGRRVHDIADQARVVVQRRGPAIDSPRERVAAARSSAESTSACSRPRWRRFRRALLRPWRAIARGRRRRGG